MEEEWLECDRMVGGVGEFECHRLWCECVFVCAYDGERKRGDTVLIM